MSEYSFYPTWNTALVSLHNVESHFGSVNRARVGGELLPVTIRSSIIDLNPVRANDQAGGETGDGFVNQDWLLTLALYGYKFLVETYFASEATVQTAWTIYTRRHVLASYQRFNCWAILPSAENGDVTPLRENSFNNIFQVRLRLRDLTAI